MHAAAAAAGIGAVVSELPVLYRRCTLKRSVSAHREEAAVGYSRRFSAMAPSLSLSCVLQTTVCSMELLCSFTPLALLRRRHP